MGKTRAGGQKLPRGGHPFLDDIRHARKVIKINNRERVYFRNKFWPFIGITVI